MRKTNAKIELFTDWLAREENERHPHTMEEFSQTYNVPMPTLYRWKRKLHKGPTVDEADEFIARLYKLAMNGKNAKYAELWAKIKGLMLDGKGQQLEKKLSASDYFAIHQEARRRLEEAGYFPVGICDICRQSGRLYTSYYTLQDGHLVERENNTD